MENKKIAKQVEQTGAYINKMFFLSMCSNSHELNNVLNDFEDFKRTFPKISFEDWGMYSDARELPGLLAMCGYDGWLVEIGVPERDRFKFKGNTNEVTSCYIDYSVTRLQYFYCQHFDDIIHQMLEFGKDILEEDITRFRRNNNETK